MLMKEYERLKSANLATAHAAHPGEEGVSVTMTEQASPFFEQPILNSPYEEPIRYHPLDAEGRALNEPPREGGKNLNLSSPFPGLARRSARTNKNQASLNLSGDDGISTEEQEYNRTPIINGIRNYVSEWRQS
jgi:type III restriction enzyme